MRGTFEGEFLGQEPWEYQGNQGFSIHILQGFESARLSIKAEDAPKKWPEKNAKLVIDGKVRPGFDNKGFKIQVFSITANGTLIYGQKPEAAST